MIHLDAEEALLRKQERTFFFEVVQVPVLRLLGYLLVWCLIAFRQVYEPVAALSTGGLGMLAGGLLSYCLTSWAILYVGFRRLNALSHVFLGLDVVVTTVVVYVTGADRSWLWVLFLVRVADQTSTNFRRVLGYAHLTTLCYGLMLLVAAQTEPNFAWAGSVVKMTTLYVVGLYLALTARTAEHLRRQTTEAIRLAQEQLRLRQRDIADLVESQRRVERLSRQQELILGSAQDGIFSVDEEGRCTLINPAALRVLGCSVEELTNVPMHDVVHGGSCEHDAAHCPLLAAASTRKSDIDRHDFFCRKRGDRFPVEYSTAPLFEAERVVGVAVVFRDVTVRIELARMKDEFISTVSHELRTPLTSIRASLGLLTGGLFGQLNDKGQHMLELAVSNTDRLVRLINDILDIERLTSRQIVMDKQPCQASKLVESAVQSLHGEADKHGVHLVQPSSPEVVKVDADRIIQVLTNLVGNAIKFSEDGSVVKLNVLRADGEVVFAVQDHGRGIPVEKQSIIFDRFQQVDASDARIKGGTGLGLAISRTIVEQHGGRIWVESAPGEGSTFFFSVPDAMG